MCDWLLSHLQRPALLAGASYGAYLAAGVARQRPDLVEGLLLVCPGVRVGVHGRDLPNQEPAAAEQAWLTPPQPSCTVTWTAPSGAAPEQLVGWCCRPWPSAVQLMRRSRTGVFNAGGTPLPLADHLAEARAVAEHTGPAGEPARRVAVAARCAELERTKFAAAVAQRY